MPSKTRPRIGISACLLGQATRYDGQSKADNALMATLSPHVEWVPICPEVECGMGVPRPAMHLCGTPDAPRLKVISSGEDRTDVMEEWIGEFLKKLQNMNLSGFVFKTKSPNCGMRNIPIHNRKTRKIHSGPGLFARAVMKAHPRLPVEDEVGLRDSTRKERFLARIG